MVSWYLMETVMSKTVDNKQLTKGKEYTKEVTYHYRVNGESKSYKKTVLIYEDQPEQLNEETAKALFEKYPDVSEIHELHDVWGGRWSRRSIMKAVCTRS